MGCQKPHNNEEIRRRLAARVAAALSGVAGAWDVTKGTPRLQWGSCSKPPIGAQQNGQKTINAIHV